MIARYNGQKVLVLNIVARVVNRVKVGDVALFQDCRTGEFTNAPLERLELTDYVSCLDWVRSSAWVRGVSFEVWCATLPQDALPKAA